MLHPVAGAPHRRRADRVRGEVEPVQDRVDRSIADGVEAGLQPGAGAGGDVGADLRRAVASAGVTAGLVRVRRAQRRGMRSDRAIAEQIPGRAGGTQG